MAHIDGNLLKLETLSQKDGIQNVNPGHLTIIEEANMQFQKEKMCSFKRKIVIRWLCLLHDCGN